MPTRADRHTTPAGPRILVVDDEAWMLDACGQILAPLGCEVLTAPDGLSGLEAARRERPDLILVDLRMPGLDGLAFLSSVKALDPDVVQIAVTGYPTTEVAVEAMQSGASNFVAKPFQPAELRAVVQRGLEQRQAAVRASALLRGQIPPAAMHLASLAHRFREPLAVARQCLDLVLRGYAGEVSEQAREMVEVAAKRTDQMMDFVDDWLSLSRLDDQQQGREAEAVDVAALAATVVARFRQDPRTAGLTVHYEAPAGPAVICAEPGRLDELLSNLVDNAVRYTPAGGRVTVGVATGAAGVELTVRDTGPGINPDEAERIFEPFYRGRSQKHIPGTGLGLAIVKRIAERCGGRVKAQAQPGAGAVFRVCLPTAGAGAEPGSPALPPPHQVSLTPQ